MKEFGSDTTTFSSPTFIGVGPEKTGTGWLDSQLRQHSDVWMPPIKELRYFWEQERYPGESFLQRLNVSGSWHRRQYVDYAKKRVKHLLSSPRESLSDRQRLYWDVRYLLMNHDDSWYLSCFKGSDGKCCGEISPQYFFLPEERIKQICNLVPDCKVLVTLRRPADWIWSFARMSMKSGFLEEKYGDLESFVKTKQMNCSYSKAVMNWLEIFGDKQVTVFFYDHLQDDPCLYFKSICDFLEISAPDTTDPNILKRVNVGVESAPPEGFLETVEEIWREDILQLDKIVAHMPESWLS